MTSAISVHGYRSLGAETPRPAVPGQRQADPHKETEEQGVVLTLSQGGRTNEAKPEGGATQPGKPLTDEQKKQVEALKARDAEVRAHEQAHLGAAGQYAKGGPSFTYQTGPDGQQYAIGGEVQIDTSPIPGDPEATIRKMQQIARAAHAPAAPSGQDHAVAAAASAQIAKAQADKQAQSPSQGKPAELQSGPTRPEAPKAGPAAAYAAVMSSSCVCKSCPSCGVGGALSVSA